MDSFIFIFFLIYCWIHVYNKNNKNNNKKRGVEFWPLIWPADLCCNLRRVLRQTPLGNIGEKRKHPGLEIRSDKFCDKLKQH